MRSSWVIPDLFILFTVGNTGHVVLFTMCNTGHVVLFITGNTSHVRPINTSNTIHSLVFTLNERNVVIFTICKTAIDNGFYFQLLM